MQDLFAAVSSLVVVFNLKRRKTWSRFYEMAVTARSINLTRWLYTQRRRGSRTAITRTHAETAAQRDFGRRGRAGHEAAVCRLQSARLQCRGPGIRNTLSQP